MAATQFRGGALSGGLTTRASDHNPTTKKARLFNSLNQSEAGKFGALSGRKDLSNANVVGGCSLSATHRALCSQLLTRRRRPCFPVVANQLSSDVGVGSSEVKEKLALEEEQTLINGRSDDL